MPMVLSAKYARYSAAASSTTSSYADENREMRMLSKMTTVATFHLASQAG